MTNYGQYCPVAKACELLGDRWTLLIVRELIYGPLRFVEIERGLPGISRSVLSQRLRRLVADGIATKDDAGAYRFTEAGEALVPAVGALGSWAAEWMMADPTAAEADPEILMLFVSRHVDTGSLPDRRVVTEWQFPDVRRTIWLTLEPADVSVCLDDPMLPVDLYVVGATRELYRVYSGRRGLDAAVGDGTVALTGTRAMRRGFRSWMRWSDFAPSAPG